MSKFTEAERKNRWENIHLAGRKRFNVSLQNTNNALIEDFFETDDYEELIEVAKQKIKLIINTDSEILSDIQGNDRNNSEPVLVIGDEVEYVDVNIELSEIAKRFFETKLIYSLLDDEKEAKKRTSTTKKTSSVKKKTE